MTFGGALKEVESHDLAARLNVASDFGTFLRAAQQQQSVRALIQELGSRKRLQEVFYRILELSRQKVDLRYENQWDTAIALYVLLISLKDFDLAKIAAQVAAQMPQCWWAKKVSTHIRLILRPRKR